MKQEIDELEEKTVDTDEIMGTDVKINPDYYIHTALLKAQKALVKDNLKEGLVQFRFMVEHIEVLCLAAGMIDKEYNEAIELFKKTKEYKDADDTAKSVRLSNKKIELMMKAVFSQKTLTEPTKA